MKVNACKVASSHAHRVCCMQAVAGGPGQQCVTNADVSPWGQPALLYGVPQGLLTANNKTYSDVNLCCGGLMTFTFTARGPIYLRPDICNVFTDEESKTIEGGLLRPAGKTASCRGKFSPEHNSELQGVLVAHARMREGF